MSVNTLYLMYYRLYEGSLQLTGWDLYSFPKEMDRQEVRKIVFKGGQFQSLFLIITIN